MFVAFHDVNGAWVGNGTIENDGTFRPPWNHRNVEYYQYFYDGERRLRYLTRVMNFNARQKLWIATEWNV